MKRLTVSLTSWSAGGARGVVEVDVASERAVEQRHGAVDAHDAIPKGERHLTE
jgi:hypothetical protein